jgi:hemerythrin
MSRWNEEFSVNVASLDEQHKMLFQLIDELESVSKGHTGEDISFIITELNAYALYHFAAEERLLARFGFPGQETHHSEHREFEAKAYEFRSRFMNDDPGLQSEMKTSLESWISEHIKHTDREYSQFLNSKGIF